MTINHVRDAIHSGRPFIIKMADGNRYPVPHPDFIALSPKGTCVTLFDEEDHSHILPLLTMTGITYPNAIDADGRT